MTSKDLVLAQLFVAATTGIALGLWFGLSERLVIALLIDLAVITMFFVVTKLAYGIYWSLQEGTDPTLETETVSGPT